MIWQLSFDEETYLPLSPTHKEDSKKLNELSSGILARWQTIKIEIRPQVDKNDNRVRGDFFHIPISFPVVGEYVWEILSPLISNQVELLPLEFNNEKLWILNPLYIVDCFDREQSKFKELLPKIYLAIESITFEKNCLDNLHIFGITIFSLTAFVSDEFKVLVEKHHLTGFNFKQVISNHLI